MGPLAWPTTGCTTPSSPSASSHQPQGVSYGLASSSPLAQSGHTWVCRHAGSTVLYCLLGSCATAAACHGLGCSTMVSGTSLGGLAAPPQPSLLPCRCPHLNPTRTPSRAPVHECTPPARARPLHAPLHARGPPTCPSTHAPPPRARRLSRDQLRRYAPARAHLQIIGWLQILLYTAAYITTTLCTPLDDQIYYEVGLRRVLTRVCVCVHSSISVWYGV